MEKAKWKKIISAMMSLSMVFTMALSVPTLAEAATAKKTVNATISYSFKGNDAKTAGFAQGTITLKSKQEEITTYIGQITKKL